MENLINTMSNKAVRESLLLKPQKFLFTLIETKLTAFFKINPKQCLENCGQETSTCSKLENSLVLLERTGFMTESSINAFLFKLLPLSPTWVRGFLLNDEGFKIWTEDRDITQVKSAALNLKSLELGADLLQAVDDILDHDVLQGQEGQPGPVTEHPRVQRSRVVTPEEHCLEVGAAIG